MHTRRIREEYIFYVCEILRYVCHGHKYAYIYACDIQRLKLFCFSVLYLLRTARPSTIPSYDLKVAFGNFKCKVDKEDL